VADRVELAFRRAAKCLIPSGSSVLVAVSGGADSVALLHLLCRLAPREAIRLGVAHLDHGLRRGSGADLRFVRRLARDLGLPVCSDRREVATLRRRDESLEESARRIRRAFLLETARRDGFDRIAVGHHLDDQAETILMRFVRGAGATALAGIRAAGPGPFVRPLLEIERDEIREFVGRRGLPFRDDPTNRDLRFDRNRVRRQLLPALTEALNPRAARHLVQAAERLRDDAQLLDTLARQSFRELVRPGRGGRVLLDASALAELAPPIGGRLVHLALQHAGIDARRIGSRHVHGVLDLARGGRGRELHLPNRARARRGTRHVSIGRDDG